MTGSSGRRHFSSSASVSPVIPGMVMSVITRSTPPGSAANAASASAPSVKARTR
jgi:hypothetical protein